MCRMENLLCLGPFCAPLPGRQIQKQFTPYILVKSNIAILAHNALPYRKVRVTVDPALALFQIHGIGRQVPVKYLAAIEMEIQSFLSDECRRKHKRPERGIESNANALS